jgi:hypothetical protein
MRPEWRWSLTAIVALCIGGFGAQSYAELASPYYRTVAGLIARGRPWTITAVDVAQDAARPGVFVRLHGEVRATADARRPAAALIGRVQAGAAIEGPVIYWSLVLAWPGIAARRRFALLLVGIPIFLGLEAATTVCQLLAGFSEVSAILAGDADPLTPWDRWSRFIESGGRDALAVGAALLTVAIVLGRGRTAAAQ